jgi:putative ABC transport system substrate-binding protein
MPSLTRAAVVWNPRNEANRHNMASLEVPAKMLGIQLESIPARDVQDMERALRGVDRRRVDATLTLADAFLWSQREQIVALAARYRLPAMYPELDFAEAGGLMAYGPSVADNFPRAASYVDKILKGAKPADHVRTGDQPQNREGPRPDDPADALTAGGSGHRVTARPAGS